MKKKTKTRNIGIKVKAPKERCSDQNCPFHGRIIVRGMAFDGIVVKKNVHRTATVEWSRRYFIPKYERYEKRRTKLSVHNPACIDAKIGDKVKIMETRPLSKTKHFVIVENLGKERHFVEKMEAIEEAKPKEERLAEEKKEREKKAEAEE
jgi:small subunit ribosomal protein S17